MSRYRRRSTKRYRDDYYGHEDYRSRRGQRGGCLSSLRRFFTIVLIVLVSIAVLIIGVYLFILIRSHYALFLLIVHYVFYIAVGFAILGVLYLAVRMITAMSQWLSRASLESAKAKQEQQRVQQAKVQVQAQRSQLQREEHTFYQKQHVRDVPDAIDLLPRRTRVLPQREEYRDDDQVADMPELEAEPDLVPGMPVRGQTFYYRDYKRLLRPGQLIMGIRKDGTARIGTWQDFKVLLILGSSSSGKTTTMVEKCLCAALSGGQLVVCDPHGWKDDSLLRRIHPLQGSLLPGTTMAIEHGDIMQNIAVFKKELDKRVHGGNRDTPVFLVVEELNRLQRDKTIAGELKEILQVVGQEGRGFNMYAIIGAQQITHLADIRKSIISCICHKVDESESRLVIPARFAKYSGELGVGQTFVKNADGMTEPLQQVLVEVQDVQQAHMAPPIRPRTTRSMHARDTERIDQQLPVRRNHGYGAHQQERQPVPGTQQKLILPQPPMNDGHGQDDDTWQDTVLSSWVQQGVEDRTQPYSQHTQPDIIRQHQANTALNKFDVLTEVRERKKSK